jgi:hypothetical protein
MRTFTTPADQPRNAGSRRETRRVPRAGGTSLPWRAAAVLCLLATSLGPASARALSPGADNPGALVALAADSRQRVVATATIPESQDSVLVVERNAKAPLKEPNRAAIKTLLERFNDILSRTNAIWKDRNGVEYEVPLVTGLALSNGDFWFGFDTVSGGRRINEALVQGPVQTLVQVSISVLPAGQAGTGESGAGKAQPAAKTSGPHVVTVSVKMTGRSGTVSFVPLDQTLAANLAGSLRILFRSLFVSAGLLDIA